MVGRLRFKVQGVMSKRRLIGWNEDEGTRILDWGPGAWGTSSFSDGERNNITFFLASIYQGLSLRVRFGGTLDPYPL